MALFTLLVSATSVVSVVRGILCLYRVFCVVLLYSRQYERLSFGVLCDNRSKIGVPLLYCLSSSMLCADKLRLTL